MKRAFLYLFFFSVLDHLYAQIPDVFTNTIYPISTRVIEKESNQDYIKSKIEIHQDYLKHKNFSEHIYERIQEVAVQSIEDKMSFQSVFNEVTQKINVCNEINSENGDHRELGNPHFERLEIELVSVVNNQAVFAFTYCFDVLSGRYSRTEQILTIKRYYRVDLIAGTIHKMDMNVLSNQNPIPEIICKKLNKLYLVSTQKIGLDEIDRITGKVPSGSFLFRIDLKEAKLIPYMSGAVLEFEEYTNSSRIYGGNSFRVFLNYAELSDLSNLIPDYKLYFRNIPNVLHSENSLFDDFNYKIRQLKAGPEKLDFFRTPLNPAVFQLEIENYQIGNGQKQTTELFQFNEQGKLVLVEVKNHKNMIVSEEKYIYFPNGNLKSHMKTGGDKTLVLYHYINEKLASAEEIIQDENSDEWGGMTLSERHYFTNNNYNYDFTIDYFGESNKNRMTFKYISGNEICNGNFCLVLDAGQNVTGVKTMRNSSSSGEVLLNKYGKVLESYFDSDRYQYYFTYDELNRITTLKQYESQNLKNESYYEYEGNGEIPSVIRKIGSYSKTEHHYKVVYYTH